MYDEREKTLEEKKERHRQTVQQSRHYMMGLDINDLVRRGLVVFEKDETPTKKQQQKRAAKEDEKAKVKTEK